MPATPVLSNGGTKRGLPISCFLNEASDSLGGILDLWSENVWFAAKGGGIGSYWGNLRSIGEKIRKAVDLALLQSNNNSIKFVYFNTGNNFSSNDFELIIEKLNPRLVVGPLLRENLIKIKPVVNKFKIPVVAYQVSGEYSMITSSIQKKIINKDAILETLLSFKRSGANAIITYFAIQVAKEL